MPILFRVFTMLLAAATVASCGGQSPDLLGNLKDDVAPVCDVVDDTTDTVAEATEYLHLIGAVHEHSGFSDGAIGTSPQDYFEAGRDLGLNFMMGSEHSDGQVLPLTFDEGCVSDRVADCLITPTEENPGGSATKWSFTKDLAADASTENFTAVRGFEWTSDRFGHANIFFSENQLDAKGSDGYAGSMEGLWTWFTLDSAAGGGDDGLLVFNHPGREDDINNNVPDPGFTFNDFELREEAAERVVGIEMFGKGSDAYDVENGSPNEGWYGRALDRGWRLGPTGSEDEHGTSWATGVRAKTVIMAEENSRDGLKAALLERRFYALAQHQNAIRMTFTADGMPMGSEYAPPSGTMVALQAEITEAFPDGGKLELVSNGGELLGESSTASIAQQVGVDATTRWYYVRLMNSDGLPVAYSAPVWLVEGNDPIPCL